MTFRFGGLAILIIVLAILYRPTETGHAFNLFWLALTGQY